MVGEKKHRTRGNMPQMMVLLAAILSFIAQPTWASFNCVEAAESTMRNDDKILAELKTINDPVSIECLGSLIRGNHFKSANFVIDTFETNSESEKIDQAIEATKAASKHVQEGYNGML